MVGFEQAADNSPTPLGVLNNYHPLEAAKLNGCASVDLNAWLSLVEIDFTVTAADVVPGAGAVVCTGSITRPWTVATGATNWVIVNPCR